MSKIDFARVASEALASAHSLLTEWYPHGEFHGDKKFTIGSLRGESGGSLVVDLSDGGWKDYAGETEKGGDLIALRAAQLGIGQLEAAREIADRLRIGSGSPTEPKPKQRKPKKEKPVVIMPVPEGAQVPKFRHPGQGEPSQVWTYLDAQRRVLMHVCRFDVNGEKEVVPRCWAKFPDGGENWAWAGPRGDMLRPLYGLEIWRNVQALTF